MAESNRGKREGGDSREQRSCRSPEPDAVMGHVLTRGSEKHGSETDGTRVSLLPEAEGRYLASKTMQLGDEAKMFASLTV